MGCFSIVPKLNSNRLSMTLFFSALSIRSCMFAEPKRLGVETFLPLETFNHLACRLLLLPQLEKTGGLGIIASN